MAQTNLKVGDIVQLKTGGPKMTISSVQTSTRLLRDTKELEHNIVKTQWFNEKNTVEYGEFKEDQLNKLPE